MTSVYAILVLYVYVTYKFNFICQRRSFSILSTRLRLERMKCAYCMFIFRKCAFSTDGSRARKENESIKMLYMSLVSIVRRGTNMLQAI